MEIVILLVIAGYALYGIYLLLLHYGHIIVPLALWAWLFPKIVVFLLEHGSIFSGRLKEQKRAESQQQDVFRRFSQKKRYYYALHPLQLVIALLSLWGANESMTHLKTYADEQGWIYEIPRDYRFLEEPFYWALFLILIVASYRIGLALFNALPFDMRLFPTTKALYRYTANPKTPRFALEYAHAMRESAKHHVTSFYDGFVFLNGLFAKRHTAHYKSKRLEQTLAYLEKHFPHSYDDEEFRRKYWNYARHIFALLHVRESHVIENSFFALPYPQEENITEADTQNALKKEREKFQNAPLDVWSKSPDRITLEDALEVIGLTDIPSIKILHKLHLAVLEEHKDDPQKAHITAKAFEILGREAVIKEMLSL